MDGDWTCAVCGRDFTEPELGPRLFWAGDGMTTHYAHAACIDWTERPSLALDLIRRIRSARRQAAELERLLGIAEGIADRIDRDWTRWANSREGATRLVARHARLLERTRKLIGDAFPSW